MCYRSVARPSKALGCQDLVPDLPGEAAPPLHRQLLEEQQTLPPHPLPYHWGQHSSDGPASLLLQRLRYAQWLHPQRLLHDISSVW